MKRNMFLFWKESRANPWLFSHSWEQRKLSEYLEVSGEKNTEDTFTKQDVLSVSGDYGIVNQIEFQGRSFAGASVSNYGIVRSGDVVYTKSPLNSNPYGIIKTNKGKPGIVSTLYAVYHPRENVDPVFVQTYFEQHARMNNYMHPLVNKGAKNDMKVSSENALKGYVVFPGIEEQCRIVSLFSVIDDLITLHQRDYILERKAVSASSEKKATAWEQRKLGDLAEIIGGGTPDTNNPDYWDGDIDWYAPAEMEGQRYAKPSVRRITELGLQKSSAKVLPAHKTVLFTSRAGIGKMAILLRPAATNQGFQSLVLKDDIDPYFIYSMGGKIKDMAESIASGSTFLEISGKMLGNLVISVPKTDEQQEIAAFFRGIDDLITLHQRECKIINLEVKNVKQDKRDRFILQLLRSVD